MCDVQFRSSSSIVPETMDVDALRTAFSTALGEYIRQGATMCDLLRDTVRDLKQIERQQQTLNEARERYESARSRYVCAVLGEFIF